MQFKNLAELYADLEAVSAKLKKTELIADFLDDVPTQDLSHVVLLIQGRVFPLWSDKEIGIATNLMIKIISSTTGYSESDVEKQYKKSGDLGLVIEHLVTGKRQRTLFSVPLTIKKVFENVQKLADIEGKGSQERKFQYVSELLSSASPVEAKYLVRLVVSDLRIGVSEGLVRDSIGRAFFADVLWEDKKIIHLIKTAVKKDIVIENGILEKLSEKKISQDERTLFEKKNSVTQKTEQEILALDPWKKHGVDYLVVKTQKEGSVKKKEIVDTIESAWSLILDYGRIATIAKEQGLTGLKKVNLEVGKPYAVLLAERSPGLKEALESFEKPILEWKYDGLRIIIHKKDEKIWLYTRRMENVTKQFPELKQIVSDCVTATNCIIEGEMLAIDKKTNRPLPFQLLSQRVKRKYDIDEIARKIPIQVNAFDVVFLEGRNLFTTPFEERRKLLEQIVKPKKGVFQLARQLVTLKLKEADQFYQEALDNNQEGIIVKNATALYRSGRRVAGGWLKVKPILETLDLAVIGATWGTGKRAGWLASLILGCRDENGQFLECGMMGTGIKEKTEEGITFEQLTALLKPHITQEKGQQVIIKPKLVIEVAYEEIQKSPTYSSGYALRFPRAVRIREDKGPQDADSLERLKYIYQGQFGKK